MIVLVVAFASSSRRVWDGGNVPLNLLERFDANLTDETPLEDLEQSAYLFWLFREVSTPRSNFISTSGSIEELLNEKQEVILCDVQSIIEYDATFGQKRAACLVRFWWNPRQEKWQPTSLRSYSSDPKQGEEMPSLMF